LPPWSPPFPYTTLFRSEVLDAARDVEVAVVERAVVTSAHPRRVVGGALGVRRVGARLEDVLERRDRLLGLAPVAGAHVLAADPEDRKSTRLNSSHVKIS